LSFRAARSRAKRGERARNLLFALRPNEKRGPQWPRNSWNLLHFHMLLDDRKVY